MSASTHLPADVRASRCPTPTSRTLTNEDALIKLTSDKSIDVVVIVAGQPAKLLADMKPEAKQYVRLLKVDVDNPATKAALQTYVPATIRSASYPNWLDQDVNGLAVKAYLVTYDYTYRATVDHLAALARSLCQNFQVLQPRAIRSGAT